MSLKKLKRTKEMKMILYQHLLWTHIRTILLVHPLKYERVNYKKMDNNELYKWVNPKFH